MPVQLNEAVTGTCFPPVAAAKARRSLIGTHGAPVDLSQAVPGWPPAEGLRSHLAGVVHREDAHGYAPTAGLEHVREAVAAYLGRHYQQTCDPGQVLVTGGANMAFCLIATTLAGPGDEILLVTPYYFNHDMWLRSQRIRPVYLSARPEEGLIPDPEAAVGLMTSRTRAIVLVTPNNPCGTAYPPGVIEAFSDLAATRGVALVLDETYIDFRPGAGPPAALPVGQGRPEHLVQILSFSKSLSLAGDRVGALVAHAGLVNEVLKLADCIQIGASRAAQEAVAYGLTKLDPGWIAGRRRDLAAVVDAFTAAMRGAGGWECVAAGGFFAWVRHPCTGAAAADVARHLAEDVGVLAIPGDAFAPGGEGDPFLRLAFGNLRLDDVAAAVDRLTAFRA